MIFFGILFIVAIIVIPKLIQSNRDETLKKQVAWTTTTSNSWDSPRALELWQYVYNIQNRYVSDNKYRISSKEEWEMAKNIIEKCRAELSADFSQNRVHSTQSTAALTPEEYFVFSLSYFLSQHKTKTSLDGKILYNEIDRKNFKDGGVDISYDITNFGIVFHKLRYITSLYCLDHPRIKAMIGYMDPESSKKTIDSKTYKISFM